MTLKDLGEKKIIKTIIKPLFNPNNDKNLIGDDCAILTNKKNKICISTDRVPSDLLAFKYGLINYFELGYYLAVLNISDSVAAGAIPNSLLLTFAFPSNFHIKDLKSILLGVNKACKHYKVRVVGGDLSDSQEISLSATIVGFSNYPLYRKGIKNRDIIFCSDTVGLTPTAFRYFFEAKGKGMHLTKKEEQILVRQFSSPKAKIELVKKLSINKLKVCCMDNTDGIGQSLKELSEINSIQITLFYENIPIHPITQKVAHFLKMDPIILALEPGADFQLVGSIRKSIPCTDLQKLGVHVIGQAEIGNGIALRHGNKKINIEIKGWNYYL